MSNSPSDLPPNGTVEPADAAGKSASSSREEPRVSALMRGEVSREELDPATVAQLAAWFGAPATGVAVPESGAAPQPLEESLWDERREVHRHLEAALDEKLAKRLESWTEKSAGLTHLPPPMTLTIERQLAKLDMDMWRVRSVETVEHERPEDISDGIREPVPQAVLRDLHRPVMTWPYLLMDQALGIDVAGTRSIESIRETTSTSYRVRMERELIASQLVYRDRSEFMDELNQPWEDIEIPKERRGSSSLHRTPEDLLWFGTVGYDPTI